MQRRTNCYIQGKLHKNVVGCLFKSLQNKHCIEHAVPSDIVQEFSYTNIPPYPRPLRLVFHSPITAVTGDWHTQLSILSLSLALCKCLSACLPASCLPARHMCVLLYVSCYRRKMIRLTDFEIFESRRLGIHWSL
jgi:hypothetical protein